MSYQITHTKKEYIYQLTHLKSTIQWVLVYLWSCVTTITKNQY